MKNYKEILKMAVGNEVEAFEFYRDAAAKMKDPAMKRLFRNLLTKNPDTRCFLRFSQQRNERYEVQR